MAHFNLNTEIFYANGSATPFMHISPMKEKNPPGQGKNLPPGWMLLHFSLHVYFIMSGIVFVFLLFLGTVMCSGF